MAQQIYDISRTISPSLAVWPGDTPFSTTTLMELDKGDPVNLTSLTTSSHTGTHVDAPAHFMENDLSMEQVDLNIYVGPATVATVQREEGPLVPSDFQNLDWTTVDRLLVHSANSHRPQDQFPEDYVYPSPELANLMGQHGVILFGSDAPSMDHLHSKTLPGHKALRRNQIYILEGLIFDNVPDGRYDLIALPLKIKGGDGSPVRAVLRSVA